MNLKDIIRTIPNFPKEGIVFKDIESITQNPSAFSYVIDQFCDVLGPYNINKIVALDARGFLFGAALAQREALALVMARKHGKLPGDCVSQAYALEYGEAVIELQKTAISADDRVLIIDDLLATGGTAKAAADLVKQCGGIVALFAFVIELDDLKGRDQLGDADIVSLVHF